MHRKNDRQWTYRPRLEALESRWCPTCTVRVIGDSLLILGDGRPNTVEIHDHGTRGIDLVCDGRAQTVPDTSRILVLTFGGDDRVDYAWGNPDQAPAPRAVGIDLGTGDDTLNSFLGSPEQHTQIGTFVLAAHGGPGRDALHVQADNLAVGDLQERPAKFVVNLYGDDGADTLGVQMRGMSFSPDGRVAVGMFGGAGADNLMTWGHEFDLRAGGQVLLLMDGGTGPDDVSGELEAVAGSTGQARIGVLGGPDDDRLAFAVRGWGNPNDLTALIDGGPGFDICTHTPNVRVQNCEAESPFP
jgi:hypothetical protein